MTFQEFHRQARTIADELDKQRGCTVRRCTNCEFSYWDYEDGRGRVVWDIWDATAHRHYESESAEGTLALYRAALLADGSPEEQLAEVGAPPDGDTEAA